MPLDNFYAAYDWQGQPYQSPYKLCPLCGTRLVIQPVANRPRPVCPACGFVHFVNPAPGVAVLVVENERVLLGQRVSEPGAGLWAIPSGYIEYDEDFLAAAIRETKEETGLDIAIQTILHIETAFLSPRHHFLTVYLLAHVTGGALTLSEETAALAWFPLAGPLPDMAFPTDVALIACLARRDFQGLSLPVAWPILL